MQIRCRTTEEVERAKEWLKKHIPEAFGLYYREIHYRYLVEHKTHRYRCVSETPDLERYQVVRETTEREYPYEISWCGIFPKTLNAFAKEPGPWACGLGHVWNHMSTCLY